jgi:hypothetical protein
MIHCRPSINAIPHRTGDCRATPGAEECYEQLKQQPREDPRSPTREPATRLEVDNPLDTWQTIKNFISRRSNRKKQADHADEQNDVSKDDASKEVTTPADAVVARPKAGLGFHPETSCNRVVARRWRPQQGERRPWAPPPYHQNESG